MRPNFDVLLLALPTLFLCRTAMKSNGSLSLSLTVSSFPLMIPPGSHRYPTSRRSGARDENLYQDPHGITVVVGRIFRLCSRCLHLIGRETRPLGVSVVV